MSASYHDYESMGRQLAFDQREPLLLESYAGTSIVQWYGNIERQIGGLLDDAEKGRNWTYADKIREFLRIWRDNEITGSINREALDTLKSATSVLGVDSWNLKNYFSNLRDQLRKLIASEEELPRDLDMNANDPMKGGGGGGRGAPPMSPDFGPQDDAPAPGAPGTDQSYQANAGGDLPPPEGQPGQDDQNVQGGGDENGGGLEGGPPAPGEEDLPDTDELPRI